MRFLCGNNLSNRMGFSSWTNVTHHGPLGNISGPVEPPWGPSWIILELFEVSGSGNMSIMEVSLACIIYNTIYPNHLEGGRAVSNHHQSPFSAGRAAPARISQSPEQPAAVIGSKVG